MAETTGIAWTHHTWSPWIGCTEVSPGCDNCYARELDRRHRYGLKKGKGPYDAPHWGAGRHRYRTKDWKKPLAWNRAAAAAGERRFVFPSLCDPFDNELPPEWREDLFDLIYSTPNLTWLLLTKRIGNAAKMLPWCDRNSEHFVYGTMPNVWLGASIVNQAEADRDIPKLLATPAAKRFVSYEPALGPVDFSRFMWPLHWHWDARFKSPEDALAAGASAHQERQALVSANRVFLDWVIVGGESSQGGVTARPFDLEWARSTVAQCKAAGVPVFVKQLGSEPRGWCAWNAPECIGKAEAAQLRADGEDGDCNQYEAHEQAGPCATYGHRCMRLRDRAGADPAEWPEDLRVQEFPA